MLAPFIHYGFLKLERFPEYVYILEHVRIYGTGQAGAEGIPGGLLSYH
jgi:hypothetical protein